MRKQLILLPFIARDGSDNLLRQNIERRRPEFQRIEPAATDGAHHRQRFEQFVAREREQPALGDAIRCMPCPADALQERSDRSRRADLAHEVDVSDVDSQFERRRRDDGLQFAVLKSLFGLKPRFAREAAVVARDMTLTQLLFEDNGTPARPAGGYSQTRACCGEH